MHYANIGCNFPSNPLKAAVTSCRQSAADSTCFTTCLHNPYDTQPLIPHQYSPSLEISAQNCPTDCTLCSMKGFPGWCGPRWVLLGLSKVHFPMRSLCWDFLGHVTSHHILHSVHNGLRKWGICAIQHCRTLWNR